MPAQQAARILGGSDETDWTHCCSAAEEAWSTASQTLAMRRVRVAAEQMVRSPDDAKGRRYWEESVTWRCDEEWRRGRPTLNCQRRLIGTARSGNALSLVVQPTGSDPLRAGFQKSRHAKRGQSGTP